MSDIVVQLQDTEVSKAFGLHLRLYESIELLLPINLDMSDIWQRVGQVEVLGRRRRRRFRHG